MIGANPPPSEFIEVLAERGREVLPCVGVRVTIGQAEENDVVVADGAVSRLHAVLERLGAAWTIRDVGSRNGTYLNGERVVSEHAVRPGDEIRVGRTRLLLKGVVGPSQVTEGLSEAPRLTPREHDVVVELCRPLSSGGAFSAPASVRVIASALFVSEAAVKQHLGHLFDKFGVLEGDDRRARLANAAVTSGAVTLSDLRGPPA